MRPAISVITLTVDDLDRAVHFYRDGLGWPTPGVVGRDLPNGAVAFFELQGGLQLALWPRRSLLAETGLADPGGAGARVLISHNVSTPEQVQSVLDRARSAGGRGIREPHEAFWGGRVAYFADLDEHLWEVVWNPKFSGLM